MYRQALHQLPRALSQLDELIDGINIKSNASILQTLELLRSVNGKKGTEGKPSPIIVPNFFSSSIRDSKPKTQIPVSLHQRSKALNQG